MVDAALLEETFDEAFDRLYPRARAVAFRILGDVARSEEVASEALARAYARWPKLAASDHVAAWVLRVTANLAIDVTRRKVPAVTATTGEPDRTDLAALRICLVEALRRLPSRQREAVTLHYLADLREVDVADALGISLSAVKTHVQRGLAALRQQLGGELAEEALHRV